MLQSKTRTWLRGLMVVSTCACLLVGGSLKAGDSTDEENCKVRPGDVNWHSTFESAQAASKESGRPVLLFQMMGNLDERFT
jgi:hypothetical protein